MSGYMMACRDPWPGMSACEAAVQARCEVDALAERRARDAVWAETLKRYWAGEVGRSDPAYRKVTLSGAIYPGVHHFGSPWRSDIDGISGRLLPAVRR